MTYFIARASRETVPALCAASIKGVGICGRLRRVLLLPREGSISIIDVEYIRGFMFFWDGGRRLLLKEYECPSTRLKKKFAIGNSGRGDSTQ